MKPRACALIFDNQKTILLIRRVKSGREYWVFPGGGVEDGEFFDQAVVREVKEETSLIVSNPTSILENMNTGRRERYYKLGEFSGLAKIANGPEIERLSDTNIYEPIWSSVHEFLTMKVLPQEPKLKVVTLWESGCL